MELLTLMMGIFGGFLFVMLALVAVLYVISSLGFVKIFTKLGYANPWFGWIPVLNVFTLATLVTSGLSKVKVFGLFELDVNIYRFLWVLSAIISRISGPVGKILAIAFAVIYYGDMFSRVYAATDNTSVEEQRAIGGVSGYISIIFFLKALASDNNPIQIRYRADDVR